jgi:myo-inositol-1(or 4)-monophosphatase
MTIRTPIMNVMTTAARKAARSMRRDFGEVEALQVSKKGPSDFVSAADQRVEQVLFAELSRARPAYGFLMEERGAVEGADKAHRFIIDPLDGTTNFLHGVPHFAISIALEREGQLIAGVIFQPLTDEMFIAERGQGAWLNDKRLRVAARTELGEALIATGVPFRGRPGHDLFNAELAALSEDIAGIRRFGSAALDLAWVAAGRFDAFWERNLAPWDIAAGIVILREAGGYVTEIEGGEDMLSSGSIVGAAPGLHAPIRERLVNAKRKAQASALP